MEENTGDGLFCMGRFRGVGRGAQGIVGPFFFSCQTTLLSFENGEYGNEILLKGDLRMDFDGCS